jgi:peptidoglycan LD-endopeptidase CwlK
MAFKFGPRSLGNLHGTHPKLQAVTLRALQLTTVDFLITDGLRTIAEQRRFVKTGKSKTMKSKHLTGRAIDYVAWENGSFTYAESKMLAISKAFKAASAELNIPIEWGGDWKSFHDTPHIQLQDGYSTNWSPKT